MQILKNIWPKLRLMPVWAVLAILIDQWTKRLVESTIALGDSVDFLPPLLSWTHTQNTGASFSMLQNGGPIFFVLGIGASAFIVYYVWRLALHDQWTRLALGLVFGGIWGNLIDRIRQGFVTDFIHFQIPAINFDFAVFNGADSFLFIGVVLLFLITLRQPK